MNKKLGNRIVSLLLAFALAFTGIVAGNVTTAKAAVSQSGNRIVMTQEGDTTGAVETFSLAAGVFKSIKYTSSNENVATVIQSNKTKWYGRLADNYMTVTAVNKGTCTITAEKSFFGLIAKKTETYTVVVGASTVTYVDYDGTTIIPVNGKDTQVVVYGENATKPADPTRTGYNFDGWSRSNENITEDVTIQAQYKKKSYTVKFVDYDGTVLQVAGKDTQSVLFEEAAIVPEVPTRLGYTFAGWSCNVANGNINSVTSDMEFTAAYTQDEYSVRVNYVDEDGNTFLSVVTDSTYHYGDTFTVDAPEKIYPTTRLKPAGEYANLSFVKKDENFPNATKEVTITGNSTITVKYETRTVWVAFYGINYTEDDSVSAADRERHSKKVKCGSNGAMLNNNIPMSKFKSFTYNNKEYYPVGTWLDRPFINPQTGLIDTEAQVVDVFSENTVFLQDTRVYMNYATNVREVTVNYLNLNEVTTEGDYVPVSESAVFYVQKGEDFTAAVPEIEGFRAAVDNDGASLTVTNVQDDNQVINVYYNKLYTVVFKQIQSGKERVVKTITGIAGATTYVESGKEKKIADIVGTKTSALQYNFIPENNGRYTCVEGVALDANGAIQGDAVYALNYEKCLVVYYTEFKTAVDVINEFPDHDQSGVLTQNKKNYSILETLVIPVSEASEDLLADIQTAYDNKNDLPNGRRGTIDTTLIARVNAQLNAECVNDVDAWYVLKNESDGWHIDGGNYNDYSFTIQFVEDGNNSHKLAKDLVVENLHIGDRYQTNGKIPASITVEDGTTYSLTNRNYLQWTFTLLPNYRGQMIWYKLDQNKVTYKVVDTEGNELFSNEETVANNTAIADLLGKDLPTVEECEALVAYNLENVTWSSVKDAQGNDVEADTLHQDIVITAVVTRKTFTVTFYKEDGTSVVKSYTEVPYGTDVKAAGSYSKNDTYANAEKDDIPVVMTTYAFQNWKNVDVNADVLTVKAGATIENVTSDMEFVAVFQATERKMYYAVLNPGLAVPAGTDPEPTANYTNKVEGAVDYFTAPGSTDTDYIYGTMMKLPTLEDFNFTLDGKKVALKDNFKADEDYIKWYVIKDEADGIHIDGYQIKYPTITYVLDGETIKTEYVKFDKQSADGNNLDPDFDRDELVLDTTVGEAIVKNNGTFSGWKTEDGEVVTSFTDFAEDTVVYGTSTYTTTIQYVYAPTMDAGEMKIAAEPVVLSGQPGAEFEDAIQSPEIEDYTASVEEVAAEELTIVEGGKVIVVVYFENDKNIVQINYYYDEVGGATAADTVVATNYVGKKAGTESVETPAIHGYTADVAAVDLSEITIEEEAVVINVVYTKNVHNVIITYVDEDGKTVDTYTESYAYGDDYKVETPAIEGSTADKTNVSGTMDDEDVEETVTYTVNRFTATYQVNGTTVNTVTVKFGDDVAALLTAAYTPAEGTTFSGWTTDFEGKTIVSNIVISGTTKAVEVEADEETKPAEETKPVDKKSEVEGDEDTVTKPAQEETKPAEETKPVKTAEVEADSDVTTADTVNISLLISLLAASIIAVGTIVLKKRGSKNA